MTQAERIHARLKRGWTSSRALNRIAFRYSARIFDLRRDGANIESERRPNGMWYYRVKPKPRTRWTRENWNKSKRDRALSRIKDDVVRGL